MHPTCKPFFLLLLCLLGTLALPAQQVFKQTLTYTPPEKGYEVRIPFAWKFIDCFGEVHLSITQKYDEITSDAYIYNGKRYTHLELGNDAFAKIGKGKTDISADVMHGQYKLGRVELKTVLDWAGGCFGQTYNVIAKLGLKNTDYVKKLQDLSLANVRIDYAGIRNMELEKKIAALEKQRSLEDKLREADEAFGREDNARAKQLYQEVLKMDPNNALAKQRLRELKTREENEKQEQAYQEQIAQGEDLLKKGDYQGAQSAFEKALNEKPDDAYAKRKIAEIERHLKDIRKSKQAKKAVVSAAQSRRHQGFFWGRDLGGGTSVGAAQSARLIGNFRLDYDIWVMAGEPVHRWRFYWEWENYSGQYGKTGYPLWISILRDTVIQIADLKKYPDLMARWDQLKPLYVEIKSDILSFKMGDEHVASAGTIRIVPEGIGRSGQELDWSLPASSNWDELFPYCNELHWDYFQALGLFEEVDEYEEKHGSDIAWPKYCFQYSDDINFYQGYSHFSSKYKKLTMEDLKHYSSSAKISKVVWPVEELQAILREYEQREKEKQEEKMQGDDFWDTPENPVSKDHHQSQQNYFQQHQGDLKRWPQTQKRWRDKYEALKNPFEIEGLKDKATVEEGQLTLNGNLHPFFKSVNARFIIRFQQKEMVATVSGNRFKQELILEEGWNKMYFTLKTKGFSITDSMALFYKKPPPLPCDQTTQSGGAGQTINEHGLGQTSGKFVIEYDMYSAPDEMIIYAGVKEKRGSSKILFQTHGKVSGSRKLEIPFSDLERGTITVEMNGSSGGTQWDYLIFCPN